ncbi:S8 family serine peptidase [Salinicoccus sp. CNSTN-B1]
MNRGTDTYNITRSGYPSPYSRIGKGPSYIIKPELVHFGGDLFALNNSPSSREDYRRADGIGISVNQERTQEPGTSFSTPRVARIAAEVKDYLGTDDLLMVKALLMHSASHSSGVQLSDEEITQKMGFGRPLSSESIVSEEGSHSITLMMKGKLEKGKEIDIMDFPFPKELVEDNKFRGRMIVTLVSNPYLRGDLESEYCQTNLAVKFGTYEKKIDVEGQRATFNPIKRGNSKNVLLESLYSKKKIKSNSDYNYERTLIKYGDKYYPVKKYACDLSEFKDSNQKYLESNRKWFVYLKGEYRDYITKEKDRELKDYIENGTDIEFERLGIEYCLVISIYDPEKETNVYGSVVNELNNLGFNYEQITIENEVIIESNS